MICLLLLLPLCSCIGIKNGSGKLSKENINLSKENIKLSRENIEIFKDTPAWDLAVAVKKQDINKIKTIAKENPDLLNFQEPNYDVTPLIWAVGMEKYKSVESLLKCGADPNIVADGTEKLKAMVAAVSDVHGLDQFMWANQPLLGETALYIASGFSWVDSLAKKDPKYVKLLLQYRANPNICYIGSDPIVFYNGTKHALGGSSEPGISPLMHSIGCGIEKTKALVEAGADINHKTEYGNTAAICALNWGGGNVLTEHRQYAYYLIVEKKAAVSKPYHIFLGIQDDLDKLFYPVDELRDWVCKLDSEDYRLKMGIINEFTNQGIDYWSTQIPKNALDKIQRLYPDTWQDYIKRY